MIKATLLGTAVLLSLSGCARVADSRFNPLNWFGQSTSQVPVDANGQIRPLVPQGRGNVTVDGRVLVQSISSLRVDRSPTGAIVTATGLAPTQGYFNAELVSRGVDNGVLLLEFRAQAPTAFNVPGSDRSRQITVAYDIESNELAGIRSVQVQSASNTRTSAR